MNISHRWLQEFVELDPVAWPPSRIGQVLTDLGIEVEHIDDQAKALEGFLTGFVKERIQHPNADKLSVCTVDVGEGADRTIVCGAPNVAAGQVVAVAIDGAVVPNGGFVIARRKLRGVESQGMICSKAELNLGEDHDGIWVLPADTPIGRPLAEVIGRNDVIYDVAVTPNRADCLSHIGIARELKAAMREDPHTTSHTIGPIAVQPGADATVQAVDKELCPRYAVRTIRGVKVQESPQWMKDRLTAVGLRPRNVIVDVTNYVLMECGQPLHAFDAGKLKQGTIIVRRAKDGEDFVTLDSKSRTLRGDMLMICDAERPVAIAGVMGGENSEIDEATTDIVIESACFNPGSIRRTAKALGISSDASYRFERGVDIENIIGALDRATELICSLAGGTPGETIDVYPEPYVRPTFRVRNERMRSMNGIDVDDASIRSICTSIGCEIGDADASSFMVTVPSWRVDLHEEIDICEEVARLVGLDNIPAATHARVVMSGGGLPADLKPAPLTRRLRTTLADMGFSECYTLVQTSPELAQAGGGDVVMLKNALGRENSAMRTSMMTSLLASAALNNRHGAESIRLFEAGKVFFADGKEELRVREEERLALLWTGLAERHWSTRDRPADLYDIIGAVRTMLERCGVDNVAFRPAEASTIWSVNVLNVVVRGTVMGHIGQVSTALCAQLDIDKPVYAAEIGIRALQQGTKTYAAVGQYPAMRRDVAFVVDDAVTAGDIAKVVRSSSSTLLREVDVFDVYRDVRQLGEGRKSIGIALTFRSDERTLVDGDVDDVVRSIISAAATTLGASIRGGTDQENAR